MSTKIVLHQVTRYSFLEQLNRGYTTLVKSIFQKNLAKQNRQKKRNTWKKYFPQNITAETFIEKASHSLDTPEQIKQLKNKLYQTVLENEEIVTTGLWMMNDSIPPLIESALNDLARACFSWEWIWNLFNSLENEQRFDEIRQKYGVGSKEYQNLVHWTAKKNEDDPEAIGEIYAKIWEDLEEVVAWHRQKSVPGQQGKLLAWIANEEKREYGNE